VSRHEDSESPRVHLGISATPDLAEDIARSLTTDLPDLLAQRYPGASWCIGISGDVELDAPVETAQVLDAARDRLLRDRCDLVILLTDIPLRHGRRPVISHASPVHGVAVISLPALGAVQRRTKVLRAVLATIDALLGAEPDAPAAGRAGPGVQRRARELGTGVSSVHGGVAFIARVVTGNLRLLAGMIRGNDPLRLALRLQRALAATVGAALLAVVTSDVWRLADHMGGWRLALVAVGSTTAICVTLIVGAELWESSADHPARQQVQLFNVATAATLAIGVIALYITLFAVAVIGITLIVPESLLAEGLSHPATLGDQLEVAWLVTSLGVVGGALGAGLETDDAVRSAAYSHRRRLRRLGATSESDATSHPTDRPGASSTDGLR